MQKIEEDQEMSDDNEEALQVIPAPQDRVKVKEEVKEESKTSTSNQIYDYQTIPSEWQNKDKNLSVAHMSYFCPGLHGPECR